MQPSWARLADPLGMLMKLVSDLVLWLLLTQCGRYFKESPNGVGHSRPIEMNDSWAPKSLELLQTSQPGTACGTEGLMLPVTH